MSHVEPHPWEYPAWHGFARETSLAVQLICSGANSIGRADYSNLGAYYVALFGFANGLERLAKIVLAADYVLTNGIAPGDAEFRKFGHHLPELVSAMLAIEHRRRMELTYPYPDDDITDSIIHALDLFADASRGRYANLATIAGTVSDHDPVVYWWASVVEPILERHYRGSRREIRDRDVAAAVELLLRDSSVVLHTDESGNMITDLAAASRRTAESAVAQKYGRFYVLRLMRWASDLYGDLVWHGAYRERIAILFGHEERVATFRVPDEFLLSRKRWPLA